MSKQAGRLGDVQCQASSPLQIRDESGVERPKVPQSHGVRGLYQEIHPAPTLIQRGVAAELPRQRMRVSCATLPAVARIGEHLADELSDKCPMVARQGRE